MTDDCPTGLASGTPAGPAGRGEPATPLARLTLWPKKLGIVSIVWGVCSLIASVLTVLSVLAMQYNPRIIDQLATNDAQKEFMQSPLVHDWLTASGIYNDLCVLLAGALVICGIGLVRRRPWSIRGLLAWAALKVIAEIASVCLDYVMHAKVIQAIAQDLVESENVPAMFLVWSTKAVIFGLVIYCALPVFVLIWLARGEIREEVAAWR